MGQRLLFIAAEFPFPPNHGGRADTWQRIRAFATAGADMQLICWTSMRRGGEPSAAELAEVRAVVSELIVLPIEIRIGELLWRLANLWRLPSHASARMPHGSTGRTLDAQIRNFDAGAIWVDGLWAAALGLSVAAHTGWPYFYRSHNIEHRYMARQAALARRIGYRIRLTANLFGLEHFERRVVRGATAVFDISTEDLAYWCSQGLARGHWLPPFVRMPAPSASGAGEAGPKYDIGFLGNLHTPNNVEAVEWLLDEVWPRVLAARPDATALVAGSAPDPSIRRLTQQHGGVTLLADPCDVWSVYASARVLVNPAQSGSGLNVKSVEMLQLDAPIVSTAVGVAGLPADIRSEFSVAESSAEFAAEILRLLDLDPPANASRPAARRAFDGSAAAVVLAEIQGQLARRADNVSWPKGRTRATD